MATCKHKWVARTEVPVNDREAAEIHRQGFWVAEATNNRDGLTRVQAWIVCGECGEPYPKEGL